MAIAEEIAIVTSQLWPQGDIRDPLGVWGFRHGVTGDATGGSTKVGAIVPASLQGAYVYTCYSAIIAILTQALSADVRGKCRLLTNWPDMDVIAGVRGYSSGQTAIIDAALFTEPTALPATAFINPQDRFLLLFDPRSQAQEITLVELELAVNILADTYAFEGYGYYWDRSVLEAPGGLRHPGSS